MTGGKRSKEYRRTVQRQLAELLPVQGVAKVDRHPASGVPRECRSEACTSPPIEVGDPFVRVMYENVGDPATDRPAEDFHPPCFRYEFVE